MEVSERIKKIMDSEGLTASAFADSLGIQRSNVSHIMNGRSGPSLDLLQKILTVFPKYNTDWLVMGRGEIYRQPVQTSIFDVIGEPEPGPAQIAPNTLGNTLAAIDNVAPQQPEPELFAQDNDVKPDVVASKQEEAGAPTANASMAEVSAVAAQAVKRAAEVQQIVVLYTDNTFSIYNRQ